MDTPPQRLPLPSPLPLRGHMALCLLGFRGSGYSPAFVQSMEAIQAGLRENPQHPVRLVDTPDRICQTCPNLIDGGCTLGGPDHEAHMQAHDREVLRRLAIPPETVLAWGEIEQRIAKHVRGDDLDAICTTCPWLPLGVCRGSVDALRNTQERPVNGA